MRVPRALGLGVQVPPLAQSVRMHEGRRRKVVKGLGERECDIEAAPGGRQVGEGCVAGAFTWRVGSPHAEQAEQDLNADLVHSTVCV